jgi:hypothetical protein
VRGEHRLDLLVQVDDRGVERVDVREQLRDQDPVVLDLEPAARSGGRSRTLRVRSRRGSLILSR